MKLLKVEISINEELGVYEIKIDYGSILDHKEFKELKNKVNKLANKIEKVTIKHFDLEENKEE